MAVRSLPGFGPLRLLRAFRFALVLFTLAFLAPSLRAQETGPVIHRLRWQSVEYASLYEVSVEVRAGNEWLEITRKTSKTETFIDCPLFIGNYRFRVGVYDLLGKPGSTTEWIYFEVRAPEKAESRPSSQAPTAQVPQAQTPASQIPPAVSDAPPQYYAPPGFIAPEESEKSIFRLESCPSVILTKSIQPIPSSPWAQRSVFLFSPSSQNSEPSVLIFCHPGIFWQTIFFTLRGTPILQAAMCPLSGRYVPSTGTAPWISASASACRTFLPVLTLTMERVLKTSPPGILRDL